MPTIDSTIPRFTSSGTRWCIPIPSEWERRSTACRNCFANRFAVRSWLRIRLLSHGGDSCPAPLLKAGAIAPQGIIIDAKSGITGAGRSPKPNLHFPEANENLSPYNVGKHRHTPEIDQILSTWANVETNVVFTPHLIPMDRGELITAYADVPAGTTGESLLGTLREFYLQEPFVRIVDTLPGTKDVSHTNFCDMTARVVGSKGGDRERDRQFD